MAVLRKFIRGVQEVLGVLLPRQFPNLVNDEGTFPESSFAVPNPCPGEVAASARAAGPA